MAAALLDPIVAPSQLAQFCVRRADIRFHNVRPNRVRVAVTVSNVGNDRSEPAIMSLQAAPLGAFVAWRDITSVAVPAIEAGESVEVVAEVDAPPAAAPGEFSRVPPKRLLTAVAADDDDEPSPPAGGPTVFAALLDLLRGRMRKLDQDLPDDPLGAFSRGSMHWAGNINVLIGGQAVERHMAQALRIYPGRTNLAMFFVGDRPDEYRFAVSGSGSDWGVALFDIAAMPALLNSGSPGGQTVPLSTWIPIQSVRPILLGMAPPPYCECGSIDVHVCQRSTGREAVVEFSLDANAAGPGCYSV